MVSVRWPAGLHLRAGSIPAMGSPTYRNTPTDPQAYWRQTVADLYAATPTVTFPLTGIANGNIPPLVLVETQVVAMVGPQGTGERWDVQLVQVQTSSQYGQPPLVIQQVLAQQAGTGTTPPPPIVAQVWRAVAGQPVHLLAVTSQGGYDTLGISAPVIAAGEQILVTWYGGHPGDSAQAIIKGLRYSLST